MIAGFAPSLNVPRRRIICILRRKHLGQRPLHKDDAVFVAARGAKAEGVR